MCVIRLPNAKASVVAYNAFNFFNLLILFDLVFFPPAYSLDVILTVDIVKVVNDSLMA